MCQAHDMVLGYWDTMVKTEFVILSLAEYNWSKLAIIKEYKLWFHIRRVLFYQHYLNYNYNTSIMEKHNYWLK